MIKSHKEKGQTELLSTSALYINYNTQKYTEIGSRK